MRRTRQRGSVIGKMILVLVIIGALAVVAAIGTAMFIARSFRVTEREKGTRIETPFGSVRVRNMTGLNPKTFGVPLYPGAVRVADNEKAAAVEIDTGDLHKDIAIFAAEYVTPDSPEKVLSFYREQLPEWNTIRERRGGMQLELRDGDSKKVVAICQRRGRTRIALASVGDPASN